MPDTNQSSAKRWGWPVWAGLAPLFLLVLFGVAIFIAGTLANQTKIPPQFQSAPAAFAIRPVGTASAPGEAKETGFVAARRVRSGDPNAKFDYSAFLEAELRERPDLDGARLYLELSRRFADQQRDYEEFMYDRDAQRTWRPGQPVTKHTAAWLRSHAELAGEFLRLAEGPGPPVRSYEVLAADPEPDNIPSMPYFSIVGVRILTAEAERRFSGHDLAGARRHWRAAIKLAVMQSREPYFNGIYALQDPILSMRAWVQGSVERDALQETRAALAGVHKELFPAGNHAEYMALFFAARRKQLVSELQRPWYSPTFGWSIGDETHYHKFFISTERFEIPRVGRITAAAVNAIHSKNQSVRILSDFDHNCSEMIRIMRSTWPEVTNKPPPEWKEVDPLFEKFYQGYYHDDICHQGPFYVLQSEASLNLLRAAIECRLGSRPPAAIADRESPWRDPFTEKPMRIVAGTSNTLRIYGHGADTDPKNPPADPASPREIYIELKNAGL